jgi:nucleotide-binding universal stress UspA family protein
MLMPDSRLPSPGEPRFVIVAALDGSDHSTLVSETAVELAGHTPRSELHFVHVIEAPAPAALPLGSPPLNGPSALAVVEEAERYVGAHARRAADRLDEEVYAHVLEGPPRRAILQLGIDLGAKLLVIGTHDPRGVRRLVLGSVATGFVREAPFPVLVARATPAELPGEFQPPCERCRESQRRTRGVELWCAQHAAEHPKTRAFVPAAASSRRGAAR